MSKLIWTLHSTIQTPHSTASLIAKVVPFNSMETGKKVACCVLSMLLLTTFGTFFSLHLHLHGFTFPLSHTETHTQNPISITDLFDVGKKEKYRINVRNTLFSLLA
jgi:hypothetical protein